jgi:hypothetical protein
MSVVLRLNTLRARAARQAKSRLSTGAASFRASCKGARAAAGSSEAGVCIKHWAALHRWLQRIQIG